MGEVIENNLRKKNRSCKRGTKSCERREGETETSKKAMPKKK